MDRRYDYDTADRIRRGDRIFHGDLGLYVEDVLGGPTPARPTIALRVIELTGALGMVPWELRIGPGEVVWLGREVVPA